MAADLHIHSAKGVEEEDFRCFFSSDLDSKYFNIHNKCKTTFCDHWEKITETPNIWIGEVSWLKAALFEDNESFIPDAVGNIRDLVGDDLPVLTEDLKNKILDQFGEENKTVYIINNKCDAEEWLDEHIGEKLFCVSW